MVLQRGVSDFYRTYAHHIEKKKIINEEIEKFKKEILQMKMKLLKLKKTKKKIIKKSLLEGII